MRDDELAELFIAQHDALDTAIADGPHPPRCGRYAACRTKSIRLSGAGSSQFAARLRLLRRASCLSNIEASLAGRLAYPRSNRG
jgi:hypothetical protein